LSLSIICKYLLTGSVAGFLAGLFGVGGGLIIVPALLAIFFVQGFDPAVSMHLALGTSLATIILTSISSTRAHHAHGAVQWDIVRQMALGLLLGGLLGALVVKQLQSQSLQVIFAVFEIIVAIKLLTSVNKNTSNNTSAYKKLWSKTAFVISGVFVSAISAVVGIGGGSLSVPLLRGLGVSMQQAVATSAALGLPIAISGTLAFMWIGSANDGLPRYSLGFVYLPAFVGLGLMSVLFAPFGARIAHKLPDKVLQTTFAVGLLLIAIVILVY